eukprot:gnl/Hemi2/27022_TR9080_c0_g2_i1.p1 gnl/Hemi2/27022_TR9080_c0_g2~~gnl/Hemi2/27022_TR9080_c0_g2_i1.p1  ORF type:complete len:112 (+),score=1.07 gnl/Hemi2/27022_TR9080_c0_g2_i1:277-612(+)
MVAVADHALFLSFRPTDSAFRYTSVKPLTLASFPYILLVTFLFSFCMPVRRSFPSPPHRKALTSTAETSRSFNYYFFTFSKIFLQFLKTRRKKVGTKEKKEAKLQQKRKKR